MAILGRMIIDTHAHLHDQEFDYDFREALERASEAGVSRIVLIGENVQNSVRAIEKTQMAPARWATVGIHPHHAKEFSATSISKLRELATHHRETVVAIGEIGLDFYYDFSPQAIQERAFRAQIELAMELQLPVVIHCREAYDQSLEILRSYCASFGKAPWGVMHCYFGTVEQAWEFFELGMLIGVGGSVTFKKAETVRAVVRELPLEAFVLETDAPYLAPVPYRGKRNEPSFLPLVAQRVAEIKGITADDVATATTQNAQRLFWP
ncbi:MAG: TatD family hydrolase [Candidatus Sumerlaeaceae bacterium]|nr:TatD family hydrolase [Candidatus Sumerlaeaceae bacterium]